MHTYDIVSHLVAFLAGDNGQTYSGSLFSIENNFFTLLGGIASGAIYALLTFFWKKPTFDENEEQHFYHIKVQNRDRSTAYNCKIDRFQKTES
jgi:hypothetical protein